MDIAWKSICESISLSGPHGISWEEFKNELASAMNLTQPQLNWPPGPALAYLLTIFSKLTPNYCIGKFNSVERTKKDQKTRLMFFVDLDPVDFTEFLNSSTDPSTLRFYCTNPTLRHSHLLQGRPLQLSDSSLQTLETIASFRRNGVTQAELARVLGCDSKNAFHWLKSLMANDLIARTPVASKKSFTYLLTLTRHLDDEISTTRIPSDTHAVISSKEIRQKIVNILACAPDQTMVSKDVFLHTGLDTLLIKNFRRAVTKLNEIGWLEYLFEDQLIVPYCRLFRLKRKPAEGLDLKAFHAAQDEAKRLEHRDIKEPDTPRGIDFDPSQPIIHQIIHLLARSYPDHLTTADLSHRFDISRKYLYKLIERILPASAKAGIIGAEGVGKVSDFVGKEKRLKLFIQNEEFRDFYLRLFGQGTITTIAQSVVPSRTTTPFTSLTPSTSIATTPFTSHTTTAFTSLNQSPLSAVSASASASSDTRTRQLRHQTLLQELSVRKVLEVGKELCQRLQDLMGDKRFTLDTKTLRRSVEILEREGQLKVVVATVPSGTRTLLISPEMDASDPVVQAYITKMNEFVRTGPLSASTQKLIKLKELMQHPDYFVEGSLAFGTAHPPTANQKALLDFGFIHGVMARAQLLHQFLLENNGSKSSFETIPAIFDRITLGLYLKLVGTLRMSRDLHSNLGKYETTRLSELPEQYKEELSLNRKRFLTQIIALLQILDTLKLIQADDHYSSLNFKFPFKYSFALQVPVMNYRGDVTKMINFNYAAPLGSFDEFWAEMRAITVDFHRQNSVSIHDAEVDSIVSLPKPVLLARYPDSWKQRPGRERDLERAIRKLAVDLNGDDIQLALHSLSAEYEVPLERTQIMYNNYVRIVEEREEARRLEKSAKRRRAEQSDDDDDDDEEDSDDSDEELVRWTPSDWSKLSVAFCILQYPPFISTSPSAPAIKWHLASQIFDKPKSAVVIRRHGLKLFKSYAELKRILEIDTIVQLIVRQYSEEQASAELLNTIFDACQAEISENSSAIFDEFATSSHEDTEVLESRYDHYMDTIDSWIQTRSFRHSLQLNNPGHVSIRDNVIDLIDDLTDENLLLLRNVLVYSSTDEFDYDHTLALLKQIHHETLSSSISALLSTNFACKNKAKDKTRLFGFPLVVSDAVRSVLEHPDDDDENAHDIFVTNSTETLTINKIDRIFQFKHGRTIEKMENSSKFDAPVKIQLTPIPPLDMSTISNVQAMWYTPTTPPRLLPVHLQNCLAHVLKSIKTRPGTSVVDLKRKYSGILAGFEVDELVGCLLANHSIELISSHHLQ